MGDPPREAGEPESRSPKRKQRSILPPDITETLTPTLKVGAGAGELCTIFCLDEYLTYATLQAFWACLQELQRGLYGHRLLCCSPQRLAPNVLLLALPTTVCNPSLVPPE
jgi:hypothetical protein